LPPHSKGRIKADATIFQGAPDGWFAPGAGETEWFKDFNDGPEMVVVPEGSFIMGSPPDEANRFDNEGPQHEVIIAKPFAVGRYTVSFEEWDTFADKSGYWPKPDDCGWGRGPQPVIGVNWDDAKAYVEWLKKESGKDYRLLSEAEWEYVCRAGSTGPFWCGPSISTEQANYRGDWTYRDGPVGIFREKTMPVNSFKPNPWGLYQVHGNVLEWVEDCWHESYSAPADGSPWMAKRGDIHVCRGGSWNYGPDWIRAACREGRYKRTNKVGLRVARTLEV
jgi:formylglycine-generating enzyme required for sulfatase activity